MPISINVSAIIFPKLTLLSLSLSTGALLEKLCSSSKQMGETGYYLASFAAAIAHIRELDLTDGNCPPPLI